jgi:multicomponent Na+:H+ antiporter subunit F
MAYPIVINTVYFILILAMMFAFMRLLRGPSLPDRVVALELIASIVSCIVGVHAIETGLSGYLDLTTVMALTGFLATIGFARYLERGGPRDD